MHEILTLQLGNLANHVATHFWNAQVALNVYVVFTLSFDLALGVVFHVFRKRAIARQP
jgi:Misato Segment II tubulin-like domain